MRTRQFARVEKIRSKERNLLEILRRQVTQQTLDLFPPSVHPGTPLQYNAPVGGTTVTIYSPLIVIAQAPTRTYVVDTAESPDPTGGFHPVTIPASNALCELADDVPINFAGQPAGEYTVFAAHQIAQEHPETRHPPTVYAEGAGVNPVHRDFFGHGEPDNTPIPREAFDPTLTPETVSEWVDRVSIGISTTPGEQHAHLLRVSWNGSVITQVRLPTDLYADMRTAFTRIRTAEDALNSHIGARGNAHGLATTSLAGFLSAADKTKLDNVPANTQEALNLKANAASLASHIGARGNAHGTATQTEAGFMSAADKAKLDTAPDNIGAAIGTVGAIQNNTLTRAQLVYGAPMSVIGRSADSTGAVADIAAGTDGHVLRRSGNSLGFGQVGTSGIENGAVTNAKISSMDAAKLTGSIAYSRLPVGTGSSQVARGNHTHTAASIGAAAANHTHTPASIGAAAASHTHSGSDITSGTVSINRLPVGTSSSQVAAGNHTHSNYVPTSRSISTGSGLTGGGNLTANRTISVDSTVVRTSGNQDIGGVKTFTSAVYFGGIQFAHSGTSGTITAGGTSASFRLGGLMVNPRLGVGRNPDVNHLEVAGSASKAVAGAWLANSDRRIKTDIQPAVGLSKLLKINPVTFRYKPEYLETESGKGIEDRVYHNYIAQEVKEVFPDAVSETNDEFEGEKILQLDTHDISVSAVKAIQELHEMVVGLQEELAELRGAE